MELILGILAFLFMASGLFLRSMARFAGGLVFLLIVVALGFIVLPLVARYAYDVLYELYLI